MFIGHEHRHGQGDDAAARLRGRGRRPPSWRGMRPGSRESTVSTFQLIGRRAAADMATNRSISSSLKRSRQPSVDALERGARRARRRPRHSASSSSVVDPARRDRLAVAVGVGAATAWSRSRGRRPRSTRPSTRAISAICSAVASLPTDVGAHHVAAQRAVARRGSPALTPMRAVEPVEVVAEGLPVPRHALLERGERHALDLRHHPADVVGVLGPQRRQREAAVAADDRGDAVDVRRRRAAGPRTAGRRSACAGRRSRA